MGFLDHVSRSINPRPLFARGLLMGPTEHTPEFIAKKRPAYYASIPHIPQDQESHEALIGLNLYHIRYVPVVHLHQASCI